MVTPLLSLDKSLSGYLTVKDITTYTSGQRALTGIMMFWSVDNFATDFNVDQSNGLQWVIPATALDTYNIYGLFNYTWDSQNNVDFYQGAIVLYNNVFYILTTAGPINPSTAIVTPALDATNWSPLVVGQPLTIGSFTTASLLVSDIYNLSVSSTSTGHPTSVSTTQVTYIDTEPFVLTKVDCLKWNVHVNISNTIARIQIINYDQTVLESVDVPIGTDLPIDLTEWGDGSYTIEIAYIGGSGNISIPNTWTIFTLPLIEVCQANACFQELFKKTLCDCDNPCDECEDKSEEHDMHMIRDLVTALNNTTISTVSQLIGIYTLSQSQYDLLTDIGQMIDKLKMITNRCGLCGNN